MSTYRLDRLFAPRSIAIVGASSRQNSVGGAILRNIRTNGFAGAIHVVNPRYAEIEGVRTCKTVEDLPIAPDVVVITAPADSLPEIVKAAAVKGAAAAIIITAGLGRGLGSISAACEKEARAKGLRLVGPNCIGVMVPHAKFNATFAAHMVPPGDLALISQSGAIAAGMTEWATRRSVGFSAIASIGDQLDV